MGGKHKQAQRVKNNARPSSSGRSAEKLGSSVIPFAGFSTVKETAGTVQVHLEEPLDPALDPQFQLVLKKMNKKDGTTKLKALQEFRQLVEASGPEAVSLVTGLWCRVYVGVIGGAGATGEGRVREAAHYAHAAVCVRAGRSLAPHIRLLAAPWLASLHDPYGPSASAASDALHSAFPDEWKRRELMCRSRRQLLQRVLDALKTPIVNDAVWQIACAFRAAAASLELENPPPGETETQLLSELNSSEQFWKLAQPTDAAWATLLAALCRAEVRRAADLDSNRALNIALTMLWSPSCSIDVSGPIWDAILLLADCWPQVDICAKLVEPLNRQLADPLPGTLTRLSATLLPLLAQLPKELASDAADDLLSAVRSAMGRSRVQHSRTELAALASAYMDCVQWAAEDGSKYLVLCIKCVLESGMRPARVVWNELAKLLLRWQGPPAERAWAVLNDLLTNAELIPHRNLIADMIISLAQPSQVSAKIRATKVTFAEDNNENTPPQVSRSDLPPEYLKCVQHLVICACSVWLRECALSNEVFVTSTALLPLIKQFNSGQLWLNLSEKDNLEEVYTFLLEPALSVANEQSLPQLVQMVFLFLEHVENVEVQTRILISLPAGAAPYATPLAQNKPNKAAVEWLLHSDAVQDFYLQTVQASIGGDQHNLEVLKSALKLKPTTISDECLNKVANILSSALKEEHITTACCELSVAACPLRPDNLAATLFFITCCTETIADFTDSLSQDIEEAWQSALLLRPELHKNLISVLHEQFGECGLTPSLENATTRLALACGNPKQVLGAPPQTLCDVAPFLAQQVAVACLMNGSVTAYESYPSVKPDVELSPSHLANYLNWQRLVSTVLSRLLVDRNADGQPLMDYADYADSFNQLMLTALYTYALATCFTQSYKHSAESDEIISELEDTEQRCVLLLEELTKNKGKALSNSLVDLVHNEYFQNNYGGPAWALCTALLVTKKLLPAAAVEALFIEDSWARLQLTQAGITLVRPEQIPSGNTNEERLITLRCTLVAVASDSSALDTALAEAVSLLRSEDIDKPISTDWTEVRKLINACWLLETALRVAAVPFSPALLDLALVRVAALLQKVKIVAQDATKQYRFVYIAACCRLVVIFYKCIKQHSEASVEFEHLFAKDVRTALLEAYSCLTKLVLNSERKLVLWPLFDVLAESLNSISLSASEEPWRISLQVLSKASCLPAQRCAHGCLRRLATAGEAAPTDLAGELAQLQDTAELLLEGEGQCQWTQHHVVLGYLLAWEAAAEMDTCWEQTRVNRLLNCVLRQIPSLTDCRPAWFECDSENNTEGWQDAMKVSTLSRRLACAVFGRWCCEAGVATRSWWSSCDSNEARRAERLTSRYIMRSAVRRQLIRARKELPQVKCTAAGGSRQISAEYHLEDTQMQLRVELGEAWPLGPPAGVEAQPPPAQQRLMQLSLAAAAGTALPRLFRLWKDALDRRYDGLDECNICFSLLHATTAQLPRLACRTCKKLFHSACLYRWFSTSNKSTCPICRNLF